MPLNWYRDYSAKTDDELRRLAGHSHSTGDIDRDELIRRLISRGNKVFFAILAAGFCLYLLLNLIFR